MTERELLDSLPSALADAVRARDYDALLERAEHLAATNATETCLLLWRIAHINQPETQRVLSYCLVRMLVGPAAEAARLWLLERAAGDVTTLVNVLSGLQVIAVERPESPEVYLGRLHAFLMRCLEHDSVAVRISVLDFLRDYAAARGRLPRRLGRVAAEQIANALESRLCADVRDEEVAEMKMVCERLRSEVPARPPIKVDAYDKVIGDLERDPNAKDLTSFLRYERLLEHAHWQAQHDKRPVLTVRVRNGVTASFTEWMHQLVELCRMEVESQSDPRWLDAPAASIPKHLSADEDTVTAAFDRFRRAAEAIDDPQGDPIQALAGLRPRQAEALAELLLEASQSNLRGEVILTQAEVAESQTILPLSAVNKRMDAFVKAAKTAHEEAEKAPELYSDDIPQANTVRQVFQAIDAMLARGEVSVSDIPEVSQRRQVNYYIQAARVLGFFNIDNEPTPAAKAVLQMNENERMIVAAKAFNESAVGRAWRNWANKSHLRDIDPATAVQFLTATAPRGISGTTIPRRASTLRKWYSELAPFFRK